MNRKSFIAMALGMASLGINAQTTGEMSSAPKKEKFILMADAGLGMRLAKIPENLAPALKSHARQLKTGFNYDVAGYVSVSDAIALGARYNAYSANAETNGFSTKDKITFVGASFLYNNFNGNIRHKIYYDIALGYMQYTSTSTYSFANNRTTIKGGTFGMFVDVGYQYAINQRFYIGPQLGFGAGVLKNVKVDGVKQSLGKDQYEGLGRLNLSAVASFRF